MFCEWHVHTSCCNPCELTHLSMRYFHKDSISQKKNYFSKNMPILFYFYWCIPINSFAFCKKKLRKNSVWKCVNLLRLPWLVLHDWMCQFCRVAMTSLSVSCFRNLQIRWYMKDVFGLKYNTMLPEYKFVFFLPKSIIFY